MLALFHSTAVVLLGTVMMSAFQPVHGATRLSPDIQYVINVTAYSDGTQPEKNWTNSYSVNGTCYCAGYVMEQGIINYTQRVPIGRMTVGEICALLGPGPGWQPGYPRYNDVQCGNGPPNFSVNEHSCPGRVDMGNAGCGQIGPKWSFTKLVVRRINCGSQQPFRDLEGNVWEADSFFKTGNTSAVSSPATTDIAKTLNDPLYWTGRLGATTASPQLRYRITVPNGKYQVTLHFAEYVFSTVGQRIFNVLLQNKVIYGNLDIIQAAGGPLTAMNISKPVTVTKGIVWVAFQPVVDRPKISAIEVRPIP